MQSKPIIILFAALGLLACKEDKTAVTRSSSSISVQASSSASLSSAGSSPSLVKKDLDSAALLLQLQTFQKALLLRDLNTLKSFFEFPIRGDAASNMWAASVGDQDNDLSRAKVESKLFTDTDFDTQVDSLLRRPDYLKPLRALKVQKFKGEIASVMVSTGKQDSSSVWMQYDPELKVIQVIFGGSYFVNKEEGWYDKSSWIFIFKIKEGNRIVFEDLQGAG